MASRALQKWSGERKQELDQLLTAHARVGGGNRGRRHGTDQLDHFFLVAVAAQFQGFSRDLHTEAVGALVAGLGSPRETILFASLTGNRKLDHGNANDATLAEDFGRLGMEDFWDRVATEPPGGRTFTKARRRRLEQMNVWRNAIVHNDFARNQSKLALLDDRLRPRLTEGNRCRAACEKLAVQIDGAVASFLASVVDTRPW